MDTAVGLKEIPAAEFPAPLESYYDEKGVPRYAGGWGWFGWECAMVDRAVDADAASAMQWLHDKGFISHDTKTLYGKTLRTFCADPCAAYLHGKSAARPSRAPACAKVLAKLAYPE